MGELGRTVANCKYHTTTYTFVQLWHYRGFRRRSPLAWPSLLPEAASWQPARARIKNNYPAVVSSAWKRTVWITAGDACTILFILQGLSWLLCRDYFENSSLVILSFKICFACLGSVGFSVSVKNGWRVYGKRTSKPTSKHQKSDKTENNKQNMYLPIKKY